MANRDTKECSLMDIIKEIASMEERINSMEDKLDRLDSKMDMLTEKLLDPDIGVASRVNRNTAFRKFIVKAVWVLYALVLAALIKLFIA